VPQNQRSQTSPRKLRTNKDWPGSSLHPPLDPSNAARASKLHRYRRGSCDSLHPPQAAIISGSPANVATKYVRSAINCVSSPRALPRAPSSWFWAVIMAHQSTYGGLNQPSQHRSILFRRQPKHKFVFVCISAFFCQPNCHSLLGALPSILNNRRRTMPEHRARTHHRNRCRRDVARRDCHHDRGRAIRSPYRLATVTEVALEPVASQAMSTSLSLVMRRQSSRPLEGLMASPWISALCCWSAWVSVTFPHLPFTSTALKR